MLRCQKTDADIGLPDALIEFQPAKGYIVDFRPAPHEQIPFTHVFCGPQELDGAICPNCHKPLLRFLALDTADPRLDMQECSVSVVSLLFCWTCNVAQSEFFYQIRRDGSIKLLRYGGGGVEIDFPYEDYPVFFPGAPAVLRPIEAVPRNELARFHASYESSQVGGEPYLLQGGHPLRCLLCGVDMPFLASISDDCLDERGLVGSTDVQVVYHFCRECCVVGAYQECD